MMIKKINLKLSDLLALGESEASLLVRMMAACNDIMLANRCVGYFDNSTEANSKEARRYFINIHAGHLTEAVNLIRELQKNENMTAIIEDCSDDSKECFNDLLKHIRGKKNHSDNFSEKCKKIRDKVVFHYDKKMFKEAINKRAKNPRGNEVHVTISNDIRFLRPFNLADDVIDTLVCRQIWKIRDSFSGEDLEKEADQNLTFIRSLCKKFVCFSKEFIKIYLDKIIECEES